MRWRSRSRGGFGRGVTPERLRAAELFYADLTGRSARSYVRGRGLSESVETAGSPSPSLTLPAGFRLGVWLDVGGVYLRTHGGTHASRLHELGMTDACIMVNGVDDASFGFGSVPMATIRTFAGLLTGSAIRLTLTSWVRPERAFIDALVSQLPAFASSVNARGIELDVEEPWTQRSPVGFASHAEAAEYLFTGLQSARNAGLEIAITPQVDMTANAKIRPLAQRADLVIPQAYSTFRAGVSSHDIGGTYGPRGLQNRAVEKVAQARQASGTPMIMGLAAYGRANWPGHTGRQIMELELAHTISLANAGVQGARYWSWKHIAGFDGTGGRPSNASARTFFRARAGHSV